MGSKRRRGNGVTLAEVAAHVGVSARTVSRVVNDEGGCTAETRDRILEAIDELGYKPNLMARALIRQRSDTIGLMATELLDPFFPEFADGVQRAAAATGRTMFLAANKNDRARQLQALTSFQGHGVDAVIAFPARESDEDLIRLAAEGLPLVVVNYDLEAPNLTSVQADIRGGAVAATSYLIESGRTKVALVTDRSAGAMPSHPSRRTQGYVEALEMAGRRVDDSLIVHVDNSIEGGREGARRLMTARTRPDAIFAYNDLMAFGILQELLSIGVFVPEDVAIIGFDDISMCDAVSPRLSSVRIDRDELGRTAVEAVDELLGGQGTPPPPRRLAVELVHRETTDRPSALDAPPEESS